MKNSDENDWEENSIRHYKHMTSLQSFLLVVMILTITLNQFTLTFWNKREVFRSSKLGKHSCSSPNAVCEHCRVCSNFVWILLNLLPGSPCENQSGKAELFSPCTQRGSSHPPFGSAWSLDYASARTAPQHFCLNLRSWKSQGEILIVSWWLAMLL